MKLILGHLGGLGSDAINVTGDVTADIVTRELEGLSGAVDHLVTSPGDIGYDGLPTDGGYTTAFTFSAVAALVATGTTLLVPRGSRG